MSENSKSPTLSFSALPLMGPALAWGVYHLFPRQMFDAWYPWGSLAISAAVGLILGAILVLCRVEREALVTGGIAVIILTLVLSTAAFLLFIAGSTADPKTLDMHWFLIKLCQFSADFAGGMALGSLIPFTTRSHTKKAIA